MLNAYKDATSSPHGYFVSDFCTTTPDSERLKIPVFKRSESGKNRKNVKINQK